MNFLLPLTATLLLPIIPAFILYKFLPSKSQVSGPFQGLNLKLTGAFGGYFLLVLTSLGLFYTTFKSEQASIIDSLQLQLKEQAANSNHTKLIDSLVTIINDQNEKLSSTEDWTMHGQVESTSPKETNLFFSKQGAQFEPTGEFEMKFSCAKNGGKASLPKSICVFNKTDGYKVINLSRELSNNPDLDAYKIAFSEQDRKINFGNPIDIQSKEKSRVDIETKLLAKIQRKEIDPKVYSPKANVIKVSAASMKKVNF